jgi:hypothetical protein
MDFTPTEKAVTIRNPSTANLFINSSDRAEGTASDFTISKNQNILTGFFTRLAMTEITLAWALPNISDALDNNIFEILYDGTESYTVVLPDGNYTVKQALDTIVALLNVEVPTAPFSLVFNALVNGYELTSTDNFYITNQETNSLAFALGFFLGPGTNDTVQLVGAVTPPNIVFYRFVDFISNSLTYCQNLKDSSTTTVDKDILYRWNFADDQPQGVDAYGYPIYQGYLPFRLRRYLAFPKQIKWDNIQPIGQIDFQTRVAVQVGMEDGGIIYAPPSSITDSKLSFNLTLLVSEV